jgi:hypothetical protein
LVCAETDRAFKIVSASARDKLSFAKCFII